MKVDAYEEYMPASVYTIASEIVRKSNIDEVFDWKNSKYFFIGKHKDAFVGIVTYGRMEFSEKILPRFLHIVVNSKFQKTRKSLQLYKETERYFTDKGFSQVVAFIRWDLPHREMKKSYALKSKYVKYHQDDEGELFYKNLRG